MRKEGKSRVLCKWMMLIVLLKFLALLGSILSLRNSLNPLIKTSGLGRFRTCRWFMRCIYFGRFLVVSVLSFLGEGWDSMMVIEGVYRD